MNEKSGIETRSKAGMKQINKDEMTISFTFA
jgi:hypothetical protein